MARVLNVVAVEELDFAGIDQSVIFVLARWSAQCKAMHKLFLQALADAPDFDTRVFMIDADDPAILAFYEYFGKVSHGYGESFWIKSGKLLLFHHGLSGRGENLVPVRTFIEQFG